MGLEREIVYTELYVKEYHGDNVILKSLQTDLEELRKLSIKHRERIGNLMNIRENILHTMCNDALAEYLDAIDYQGNFIYEKPTKASRVNFYGNSIPESFKHRKHKTKKDLLSSINEFLTQHEKIELLDRDFLLHNKALYHNKDQGKY